MNRSIFFLTLILTSLYTFAQEVKRDTLDIPYSINRPTANEKIDKYLQIETTSSSANNIKYSYPKLRKDEQIIYSELPFVEYIDNSIFEEVTTKFPYAYDYNRGGNFHLIDNLSIGVSTSHNTYLTYGAVQTLNTRLLYSPINRLTVSGGGYISRYGLFNNINEDIGFHGGVKYWINDRIAINGFGQYSVYANRNRIGGPTMDMYPHTYYGGTIEFKITEKFGVAGGVMRELNPFSGKWENKPYIAPVFYGK